MPFDSLPVLGGLRPPPSGVAGLAPALAVATRGLSRGLRPPPRRPLEEWAEAERVVSAESGTSKPGKWSNKTAPYLTEILHELSLSSPARSVTVKKAAQVGVTECGLNLAGQVASETPCAALIVLPSIEQLKTYVRTKLQPMIDATPCVDAAIAKQTSRDEDGSTTTNKKFPGGYLQLTTASSSKGLQMISVRVIIFEEVSEYPADVDNRGDPVAMGEERAAVWSGREKIFYNSTPALKGPRGACRVSDRYEISDKRRYYVPCPHCGMFQTLDWDRMRTEGALRAHVDCAHCQTPIANAYKQAMLARGVWLKTFDGPGAPGPTVRPDEIAIYRARSSEGRQPGFAISKLYSPFKAWADVVVDWHASRGVPSKEKTFCQQTLGEPYEERGDAADPKKLLERVQAWESRTFPRGALRVTGAADVQGWGVQWGVYAWGIGLTSWRIDGGVIAGDPNDEWVWRELDKVLDRKYPDAFGGSHGIDAFGVDTGYLSQKAYRWVRRHAAARRVYALDGRHGWKLPPLLRPKKAAVTQDGKPIGKVLLWGVGTYDQKSELYSALRKTLAGPDADGVWPTGVAHFNRDCDLGFFEQLTAEHIADKIARSGVAEKVWVKDRANEEHDIAVYSRALVHHLTDAWTPTRWLEEAAKVGQAPETAQQELLAWVQPHHPGVSSDAPQPPARGAAGEAPPTIGDEEAGGEPPAPPADVARAIEARRGGDGGKAERLRRAVRRLA